MKSLLAWGIGCGRYGFACVAWLSTWIFLFAADIRHCRTVLGVGFLLGSKQPAAFLVAQDWGQGSWLLNTAKEEQQRATDSCGPAALRRVIRILVDPVEPLGTSATEPWLVIVARQVDSLLTTQGDGCTLGDLRGAAHRMGLTGRLVALDGIDSLSLPAILHLRRGHFVVLEDTAPRSVQLFDPVHGILRVPRRQLGTQLSGAALLLTAKTGDLLQEASQP